MFVKHFDSKDCYRNYILALCSGMSLSCMITDANRFRLIGTDKKSNEKLINLTVIISRSSAYDLRHFVSRTILLKGYCYQLTC